MRVVLSVRVLRVCAKCSERSGRRQGTFKWVPNAQGDAPEWAQRMYSGSGDFHEVVDSAGGLLAQQALRKDLHERNFQALAHARGTQGRTRRTIRDAGNGRGGSLCPAAVLEGQWSRRAAPVDPEWQAIGPFETWNNQVRAIFPVSWQCNLYCFDQCAVQSRCRHCGHRGGGPVQDRPNGLILDTGSRLVSGIRTVTQCAVAPTSASDFISSPTTRSMARSMEGPLGTCCTTSVLLPTNGGAPLEFRHRLCGHRQWVAPHHGRRATWSRSSRARFGMCGFTPRMPRWCMPWCTN